MGLLCQSKLSNLCTAKKTMSGVKRKPTEWEKNYQLLLGQSTKYLEYMKNYSNRSAKTKEPLK